jgi:hypothetical protein
MKANMRISPRSAILLMAACLSLRTSASASPVPLDPPAETTIPKGPEGDAIKLGKLLLTILTPSLAAFVFSLNGNPFISKVSGP